MNAFTLRACALAKINWDLRILGKRPDHFHELDSIFVTIALSDAMTFDSADALTLTCSDWALPVDASNLVVKAAALLQKEAGFRGGASIHLEKHIPAGGGLGGGSSDAACALTNLNRLWKLDWSLEKLGAIAAQVGSDVAYFLHGGWCLCRGRGEIVERLPQSEKWPAVKLLLVLPPLHVATPLVYKALQCPPWDGRGGRDAHSAGTRLNSALNDRPHGPASGLDLRNDLTSAAREVEPRLSALQTVLQFYYPDRWAMSGSGASHFVVPSQNGSGPDPDEFKKALRDAVVGTRVIETETRAQ